MTTSAKNALTHADFGGAISTSRERGDADLALLPRKPARVNIGGKFGLIALLLSGSVLADTNKVYSWTDSAGNIHYSDQTQANAHEVKTAPPPSSQAVTTGGTSYGASDDDAHAQECQHKRDQLTTYQNASKITETDALGKTREYSPEEQQKLIDITTASIHDLCTPQ